ncbi:MAG: MoaD/ThiS family protein [Oscillatoriales cyanobacterium SM2_1_8]|nr:MoaD/ThiS family protein [Oscillatoriales cyanobacterium SM2_1_8]
MIVTLRLFAVLRELAGTDTLTVEVATPATVAAVQAVAIARYPALAPWVPHLRHAVNGAWADLADPVQAGDEIALLPPRQRRLTESWNRNRRSPVPALQFRAFTERKEPWLL